MVIKHKYDKLIDLIIILLIILTIGVIIAGSYKDKKTEEAIAAKANIINKQSEEQKTDNLKLPYENKNWLAIGDAITYNNRYQIKVANLCKMSTVTTEAKSEEKLGTMADGLTTKKLANIDLVTVFGGTDDYGGNTRLGLKNDDETKDTFYGNIRKVINKIQSLNPKAKIVFITPLKRGKYENQVVYPAPNNMGNKLERYVEAIKYVCGEKSIQVIDLFNDSGINENNIKQYTIDNLHPNGAGYEKISQIIADNLNNSNKTK